MIAYGSRLWQYLSPQQRVLAGDGEFLIVDSERHPDEEPTDFSYIVFPFAKMYEGFLKQLFLDLRFITERDYYSNHFRIGKALSPTLVRYLGRRSAYGQMARRFGPELAEKLWHAWKEGRNLVFHYFPHNYRALSRQQAINITRLIVSTMEEAVEQTGVRYSKPSEVCFVGRGGKARYAS